MNNILVYGSLRKTEYNNTGRGMEYLETGKLPGFDLYSLGSYPGIKPGKGEVVVEAFKCDSETALGIYRMEIGAGYTTKTYTVADLRKLGFKLEQFKEDETFIVYPYDHEVEEDWKVEHGDWCAREDKNEIKWW